MGDTIWIPEVRISSGTVAGPGGGSPSHTELLLGEAPIRSGPSGLSLRVDFFEYPIHALRLDVVVSTPLDAYSLLTGGLITA